MKNNQGGFIGIALAGIIGVVLLAAVGSALNLITIPWLRFDSKVNMERDIVKKTYNADNAIYNSHWFKEKAGAIRAAETNMLSAEADLKAFQETAGPRDKWTFDDKQEESRLRSVATGLRNARKSDIEEYNARAQEVDRAIFVDGIPLFFQL